MIPIVGEGVETEDLLSIFGGKVNWNVHFGEQFGNV